MRTLCLGHSRGSSAGPAEGNAFIVASRSSSAPIMNSPAGMRTSFMPMEFVITSGSVRSPDVDLDLFSGDDKPTAALTAISTRIQHRAVLCIITSSKTRTPGSYFLIFTSYFASFCLKRSHIDREPVFHIRLEQSLISFVYFLNWDDFDIGCDVVFAAKIEHLLRLRDTADAGPGETATPHDETERWNIQRLCRSTDERKIPIDAEQIEIRIDVVIGGNGVDDEIETAGVFLHFIRVARDDSFIGAEAERVVLFVRRRGEHDNVRSERMSKFHCHMTESAETNHANFLALADTPMTHWRVRCDPRAQQRRRSGEI